MSEKAKLFGKMGEDSACAFLMGEGYTIIARNARVGHLETDIIARKADTIVFAEVKTRSEYPNAPHRYGRPCKAVTPEKREKLLKASRKYMQLHQEEYKDLCFRIDIIEVYIKPGSDIYKVLKIIHLENSGR